MFKENIGIIKLKEIVEDLEDKVKTKY